MVGITDSMDMNLSQLQETVKDRGAWVLQFMRSQRVRHDLATEQQATRSFGLKGERRGRKGRNGKKEGRKTHFNGEKALGVQMFARSYRKSKRVAEKHLFLLY